MDKIMYEVTWVEGDGFYAEVSPIRVIREGILPGCTSPTITAIDTRGSKFQGSPDNYFLSESDAWAEVRKDLVENISSLEIRIASLQEALNKQRVYLAKIIDNQERKQLYAQVG